MAERMRGTCHHCGRRYTLTKAVRLPRHAARTDRGFVAPGHCPGSGGEAARVKAVPR